MRLLITSDVHGAKDRLEQVVKKHKNIDYHLNAGDMCLDPYIYEKFHVITVKGNNDFFSKEPYERTLEINGLKIYLTHGHKEHVKFGLDRLLLKAQLKEVDLVIFGHTHQKYVNQDSQITILNPGALGDYHKSYAIYDEGQVTFYEL